MALLKKSAPAEPFRVPSLEEVSPDYAALVAKHRELDSLRARLEAESADLRRQIAEDPAPQVPARVAELLGDPVDSKPMRHQRLAEIRREIAAIETALPVLRQRMLAAKTMASVEVCRRVKPEYARRVKAMADAIQALAAARAEYDAMVDDFVAEDIAWTALKPMQPNFCGDRQDGHLQRWLRDAREAGYVD